jgi:assimilatory nitrate reductase catalytic subunit
MTRTGLSARLAAQRAEPFVEVHPADAAKFALTQDGFAQVTTPHGVCVLKVIVSDGAQQGSLFAPIHWSGETAAFARVGELVGPATDPFSGQPEAKATIATVAPALYASRGFVLARHAVSLPKETWWSRVAVALGEGYLLASNEPADNWRAIAHAMFPGTEIAEYFDAPRGLYRMAAFVEGRLDGCLFVGPAEAVPQWDAVKALFESEQVAAPQRRAVLSGKSADGLADNGPVICACFGVGLNVIRAALADGTATSVETIGAALKAGTNCGSCLPELKRIVAHERAPQAV